MEVIKVVKVIRIDDHRQANEKMAINTQIQEFIIHLRLEDKKLI